MKCSVNFSWIKNKKIKKTAHKNMQVFSYDKVENKLCKTSVFWMNDNRIHQNMKIARDDRDYCSYDQRSSWWASRNGLQHDHIRFDTVMISMNFNSYASLVIFFIISVLFCFVFEHWTLYTIWVLAVWFLLPYVSLKSNWTWKCLKLGMSILFFLWGFSYLLMF